MKQWLKHAFAVDSPGAAEPTEAQRKPVDWISHQVTKRQLTTPALITLEMCRPLNWITAQGMHLAEPAVWTVAPRAFHENYKHFASFLEHRGSLDFISRRIEEIEAEYEAQEKQRGKAARKRRVTQKKEE